MPTPTSTPSPAELVRDATQIVNTWNSLGPVMALLAVVALAIGAILLVLWSSRNSNSAAITVLAQSNSDKEKELSDLKAQRAQENAQHQEIMLAVKEQMKRSNDIGQTANETLITVNNRGLDRDTVQKQLAEDVHTIVSAGSLPVQEILNRVRSMAEVISKIDARTADWSTVALAVTPLMIELGALRTEAKKHSTQPIPAIDPPANGTETPQ